MLLSLVSFELNGFHYRADLIGMTQTNLDTGKVRSLRMENAPLKVLSSVLAPAKDFLPETHPGKENTINQGPKEKVI